MGSALDEALLLKQNPDRLFFQQQLPLPDGVAQLIRIAIDPASVSLNAEQRRNLDDAELQTAATAYLKGVCLFPGSQSLRVLGLNGFEDNKIQLEHRRLLLKWLHPDRNPENRHLAERVNRAWSQIKLGTADTANVPQQGGFTAEPATTLKPRSGGRFPLFLAGLAVLAASLWLLSLWPDSTEYLGAAPPPPDRTAEPGSDTILPQLPPSTWGEPMADMPEMPAPAPAVNPQSTTAVVVEKQRNALPGKDSGDRQPKDFVETGLGRNVSASAGKSVLPPQAIPDPVTAATSGLAAVEPVATPSVSVTVPAEQAAVVSTSQAQAALQRFLQLYRDGDQRSFMLQFSSDARNNRGGKPAIEADYSRLFQQSKRRDLALSDMQWQQVPDGLRFRANFRSKVTYVGQLTAERNSGHIELLFRSEGGQVRIARILVFTG
jgi:hypothetical protein